MEHYQTVQVGLVAVASYVKRRSKAKTRIRGLMEVLNSMSMRLQDGQGWKERE